MKRLFIAALAGVLPLSLSASALALAAESAAIERLAEGPLRQAFEGLDVAGKQASLRYLGEALAARGDIEGARLAYRDAAAVLANGRFPGNDFLALKLIAEDQYAISDYEGALISARAVTGNRFKGRLLALTAQAAAEHGQLDLARAALKEAATVASPLNATDRTEVLAYVMAGQLAAKDRVGAEATLEQALDLSEGKAAKGYGVAVIARVIAEQGFPEAALNVLAPICEECGATGLDQRTINARNLAHHEIAVALAAKGLTGKSREAMNTLSGLPHTVSWFEAVDRATAVMDPNEPASPLKEISALVAKSPLPNDARAYAAAMRIHHRAGDAASALRASRSSHNIADGLTGHQRGQAFVTLAAAQADIGDIGAAQASYGASGSKFHADKIAALVAVAAIGDGEYGPATAILGKIDQPEERYRVWAAFMQSDQAEAARPKVLEEAGRQQGSAKVRLLLLAGVR